MAVFATLKIKYINCFDGTEARMPIRPSTDPVEQLRAHETFKDKIKAMSNRKEIGKVGGLHRTMSHEGAEYYSFHIVGGIPKKRLRSVELSIEGAALNGVTPKMCLEFVRNLFPLSEQTPQVSHLISEFEKYIL